MSWLIYLIIFCVVMVLGASIFFLRKELDDMIQLYREEEKERKQISNSLRLKGLECESLKKQIKRMEKK